jgi:predicted LPLAT superfamily acyltransferase
MLEDYVHDLEGMVKQFPEQWFNYYDFWAKPE